MTEQDWGERQPVCFDAEGYFLSYLYFLYILNKPELFDILNKDIPVLRKPRVKSDIGKVLKSKRLVEGSLINPFTGDFHSNVRGIKKSNLFGLETVALLTAPFGIAMLRQDVDKASSRKLRGLLNNNPSGEIVWLRPFIEKVVHPVLLLNNVGVGGGIDSQLKNVYGSAIREIVQVDLNDTAPVPMWPLLDFGVNFVRLVGAWSLDFDPGLNASIHGYRDK